MIEGRALITGATGFVGSHLATRLVADGWQVHIVCRQDATLRQLGGLEDRLTVQRHDGSTAQLSSIIKAASPDIVFHLASLFISEHGCEDVSPLINSNIHFPTQLVEAMVQSKIFRLVNTGTSWQHFENRDYNPVNLYAATKQAFEDVLRYYVEATPLRAITLKLFDTYGPNDSRPKLFNFLRKVTKDQEPLGMSVGNQLIDLVYIDDVVNAFIVSSKRLLDGKVDNYESYAISSKDPIKLRSIIDTYEVIVGKKLPIQWGECPYRHREVMSPWNNGGQLSGWTPKIDLKEGIKRIVHIHNEEK